MRIAIILCLLLAGCATDTEYFGGRLGPWVKDDLPDCMVTTISMSPKRTEKPYAKACRVN